jgi:hypothetical protein
MRRGPRMSRLSSLFSLRTLQAVVLPICASFSQTAQSAEFDRTSAGAGSPDVIEVLGNLVQGDEKKFIDVAIGSTDAIVVFHSRGGNLRAGIEIGRAIRLKGFSTFVPDNLLCASACALAWLF